MLGKTPCAHDALLGLGYTPALPHGRKIALPDYNVISIEGEAHCQHFKVSCSIPKLGLGIEGEGSSRKIAEQNAAEAVLKNLKNNSE